MKNINEKEKNQNLLVLSQNKSRLIDSRKLNEILNKDNNHGVCGSINLGNTCYINSSIACLSNCTELTAYFLSKEFKNHINSSNKNGLKGKLANAWYQLLKDYWKTDKRTGNPSEIKSLIGKKYKKFDTDDQQDANEFIILFLELLGEDLNEIKSKKYLELQEQQPEETDEQGATRFWELYLLRNNSIITDLFSGLNKSTIFCPICKYKSITYNPFTSISLLIPNYEQLKKVKYLNFSKDDIFIFYIPKLSLYKAYKAKIRINKGITFNDIIIQVKEKINDFPFKVKKVDFISVINKQMINFIKGNDIYNEKNKENELYYFAFEKDNFNNINNKETIFIPIYIKIGDNFSSYPRGLYYFPGMKYKYLKKKIYMIIRKFLYVMIPELKKYRIDRKIKKILNDEDEYDKNQEESLLGLIMNEYEDIFKEKQINGKIIFPYNISIQKNIKSQHFNIIFDGSKDIFSNLNQYQINSNESEIDLLAKDLRNLNNILVITINNKSEFSRDSITSDIDKCIVVKSDDYCRNDFVEDNIITLDDCFQLFNLEENLEIGNEWFCKNCKNHVNALKKLEFFFLPKIMCICLSRFKKNGSYYTKNEKYIEFPINNLDMNKYIIYKDGQNYIYDIFAVCEHYGGREGGHYTAICKNYDGKWYSYDDSNLSLSSENEVCTRNAYILFYRRRV